VVLTRGGVEVARRWPRVHASGRYETELPVARPGTYRAAARFDLPDLWAGTAASGARAAPLPALSSGAKGTFVGLLEHRLVGLGYRLDGVDGVYDVRTGDAVVAFHKVQGMPRRFAVSAATWRALAAPLRPKARFRRPAAHIEIDQTRQVLYAVRDGRVAWISHVSTGKPSTPTYDGTFHVYRKVRGTYNSLYYPSYFDGGRAIHGWKDVPTYAASHGCVRFPFWNAVWIFRHAPIDTAVRIYH
jgi:lipoprotein-anchoring transpeptidase ErfK/SrfK